MTDNNSESFNSTNEMVGRRNNKKFSPLYNTGTIISRRTQLVKKIMTEKGCDKNKAQSIFDREQNALIIEAGKKNRKKSVL